MACHFPLWAKFAFVDLCRVESVSMIVVISCHAIDGTNESLIGRKHGRFFYNAKISLLHRKKGVGAHE